MTALLYLLGVVVFVLAILASIGLHELGHMVPAKAFGGKVTQYFIGFGPTVWSRQRGETEYGVKAIPLGGYVKIVGMLPPDAEHADKVEYDADGNRVVTVRKSNTGMFAPADLRRPRGRVGDHHGRRRGPALLPDGLVEEGHRDGRRPDGEPADRVLHLRRPVRDVRQPRRPRRVHPTVDNVVGLRRPGRRGRPRLHARTDPVSPAPKAGLQAGDRFVSFNGTPINDWDQHAGPDPRQRRRRRRRSSSSATASTLTLHTDTMVEPRPTDPNDPTRS